MIWLNRRDIVGGWPRRRTGAQEIAYGPGRASPDRWPSPRDRSNDIVGAVLLGLGLMTALTTVYLALRPPEPRPELTDEDEARLRELLERGTATPSATSTLRRDKSVIWSATGKAAIAYRVVSGVMLASGDPIGDPEAWPGAIKAFLDEASAHAWTPGGARLLRARRHGLGARDRVRRAGARRRGGGRRRARSPSRAARCATCARWSGRIARAGYTVEVMPRRATSPPESAPGRCADAAAWRSTDTERGFSMALGRLLDPADPDCVFVAARQDGVVRAFLQFVPWGTDGMSLDVMRRDRTAEAGVNELMIVEALQGRPALGVTRVSLNFAAFRSALERGEQLGAGPIMRAWRRVLLFASRWFQIESLYRFNAKFQPQLAAALPRLPGPPTCRGSPGRARGRGVPHLAKLGCSGPAEPRCSR